MHFILPICSILKMITIGVNLSLNLVYQDIMEWMNYWMLWGGGGAVLGIYIIVQEFCVAIIWFYHSKYTVTILC